MTYDQIKNLKSHGRQRNGLYRQNCPHKVNFLFIWLSTWIVSNGKSNGNNSSESRRNTSWFIVEHQYYWHNKRETPQRNRITQQWLLNMFTHSKQKHKYINSMTHAKNNNTGKWYLSTDMQVNSSKKSKFQLLF